jgi:hypothetical protein
MVCSPSQRKFSEARSNVCLQRLRFEGVKQLDNGIGDTFESSVGERHKTSSIRGGPGGVLGYSSAFGCHPGVFMWQRQNPGVAVGVNTRFSLRAFSPQNFFLQKQPKNRMSSPKTT